MMTMRVGFVGAGKVGSGFGQYLRAKGITISGYFDLCMEASQEAGAATESTCFKSMNELLQESLMVLITTPDDGLESTCMELVKEHAFTSRHLVGHMSGAASCQVLAAASEKGCQVFGMHPIQAFADSSTVVHQLEASYFGLEVKGVIPTEVMMLLKAMGNPYVTLTSDQKANYHMAAVIVSNYLTTLMDFGLHIFEKAGISKDEGWVALRPLITGALQNIDDHGPAGALTGPIARGDQTTVLKHLEALKTAPDDRALYTLLGKHTLALAQKEKLKDSDRAYALRAILEENW